MYSRYKQDLTIEQKSALLETLRVKVHPQITPEIRREIIHSVARGEEMVFEGENGFGQRAGNGVDGRMEVEIL